MKQITCKNCNQENNPESKFCSNCGNKLEQQEIIEFSPPKLASNLDIGRRFLMYNGVIANNETETDEVKAGEVVLINHKHGIRVSANYQPAYDIHHSQIKEITLHTQDKQIEKSVIGRAVVGSLFGGIGAIVGGISGVGTKTQKHAYLTVTYWNINSNKYESLIFHKKKGTSEFDVFIFKYERASSKLQ